MQMHGTSIYGRGDTIYCNYRFYYLLPHMILPKSHTFKIMMVLVDLYTNLPNNSVVYSFVNSQGDILN